jgi:penicillin amidase
MQLLFMRILGQGRAAELLDASLIEVDRFFHRMNWRGGLEAESAKLSEQSRIVAASYVEGINLALARSVPWEMRLMGHRPDPWRIEDSLLIARMSGYLTLAQSQGDLERLIVQLIQAGVSDAHLEELFPKQLGALDRALIEKVRLGERIVPEAVRFLGVPRLMASNNWVVSGSRTASGRPILCNDPHLEVNRLPAVWYEAVLETPRRYAVTATMPGLPALLLARTDDLAWGATYTFADAIDSWIEHVKEGRVRRGDEWVPLHRRAVMVKKKGGGTEEMVFWESDEHGTLDGDPTAEGFVLSTRWASSRMGARSFDAFFGMWSARSVEEGMRLLGATEAALNWVLADSAGHIGYQMSGLIPVRRAGWSGLVPVPGWERDNDWRGFHSREDLPRSFDPELGFIATANDDLNHLGKVAPINADMGPYRAERIREMLSREGLTADDMKRIQLDVRSKQAERFLEILRPLLPDTPDGRALASWNLEYDADSRGADAFERFYAELFRIAFGALGREAIGFLEKETGIFTDFYAAFDRVLLAPASIWFGAESREQVYRRAAERALIATPRRWGDRRKIVQRHILLGEKLPLIFGFDRGPIELCGGRATPRQGQIYRAGGRLTTFAPSFRFIADFAERGWESCLAGGPSDRRFSPHYASEMDSWLNGRYKRLTALSDT